MGGEEGGRDAEAVVVAVAAAAAAGIVVVLVVGRWVVGDGERGWAGGVGGGSKW